MFLLFLSTLPSHPVGFHYELLPSSDIQSTAAGLQGLIGPFIFIQEMGKIYFMMNYGMRFSSFQNS